MNKVMPQSKTKMYPAMIILLIGGFLVFSAWSARQAAGLGTKVTDADYYSKGLKYNTSQVEKRAAEVLGWNLETGLTGRALDFHLTDRDGSEVKQANGTLYLAIPGRAENIHLPLQEATSGHYQVNLAENISGTIQARLELERDGARLNRQLLLNL
ncbi:MAG: FixH family protein [Proteobacteria bacterium]|nr:FixH family protein [Pseudomonadota bacterium]MBU1688528.1 FixH family protein [Pseudomonadota bacterium]